MCKCKSAHPAVCWQGGGGEREREREREKEKEGKEGQWVKDVLMLWLSSPANHLV